jgi:hypothetical protein
VSICFFFSFWSCALLMVTNIHLSIGLFYNAIPYQYWKDEVEKWASETYPEHWEHLMKMKRVEREEGLEFEGISNDVSV